MTCRLLNLWLDHPTNCILTTTHSAPARELALSLKKLVVDGTPADQVEKAPEEASSHAEAAQSILYAHLSVSLYLSPTTPIYSLSLSLAFCLSAIRYCSECR